MDEATRKNLGPLAWLAGSWEGTVGDDTAPADDRGVERNKFRERITFELLGQVDNHEQHMHGLRYSLMAWEEGNPDPFHQELGYWLWDPQAKQVMRCTLIPRGVALLAGGTVEPDARTFALSAEVGSPVFGICSNPFLDREFKTLRFDMKVTIHGADSFSYEQDTQIQIKGKPGIFHHVDKNTLRRTD